MQDHTISDKDIMKPLTGYLTICIMNYISRSLINSPKDLDLVVHILILTNSISRKESSYYSLAVDKTLQQLL